MIIKSSMKEYELNFIQNARILEDIGDEENCFYVIDKNVYEIYYQALFFKLSAQKMFLVEALEENKKIETVLNICEAMTEISAKRNAHLISFGGGIIQDITGFVANILYRGIKWTYIPTTLLAACDSCIGGKTSLNYKQYKNLLGTFYAPDTIYILSEFFYSLSEKDYRSGLGEVIKFNIMFREEGLERIEKQIDFLLDKKQDVLEEFILKSLLFKKDFIEQDEFDKGNRVFLNFGHTFGHAFESVTHYGIPHGTAVAIGILVANKISSSRGMLRKEIALRIEEIMKKIIKIEVSLEDYKIEEFIDAISKDKKQTNQNITAILFDKNFELQIYKDLTVDEIEQAINYVVNNMKNAN